MLGTTLVALFAGLLVGTFTGITPGIHANLVAAFVATHGLLLLGYTDPLSLAVFLVALGVTHSMFDVIPAIFLGAPDPSTILAVMPGHRMLFRGLGYEAVKLAMVGSFLGLVGTVLVVPVIAVVIPLLDVWIKPWLPWILSVAVIWSVWTEPDSTSRIAASIVLVLSGFLGFIVLSPGFVDEPLFPLLTGLFGVSSLLASIGPENQYPLQRVTDMIRVPRWTWVRILSGGISAGTVGAFLPGLGPAHVAGIASLAVRDPSPPEYLALTGVIGTVNFVVSIVTFWSVGGARNGIIAALATVVGSITPLHGAVLLCAALTAAPIAMMMGLFVTKVLLPLFSKIPYHWIAKSVLAVLLVMTVVLAGPIGLAIVVTATAIGLLPGSLKCAHHHAMGCLLLPVIVALMG